MILRGLLVCCLFLVVGLIGCNGGGVSGFQGPATITSVEPSGGTLRSGQSYTINVSFDNVPQGLYVSGAPEWSLQGRKLTIKTERCSRGFNPNAGIYYETSMTIKIQWSSGAKTLNYRCF